jgi:hypothetical protein
MNKMEGKVLKKCRCCKMEDLPRQRMSSQDTDFDPLSLAAIQKNAKLYLDLLQKILILSHDLLQRL